MQIGWLGIWEAQKVLGRERGCSEPGISGCPKGKKQMRRDTVGGEFLAVTGAAQHKGSGMGIQHGGSCRIRMIPVSFPREKKELG